MTRPTELSTGHGSLLLPAFLPDATRAVVRTVDVGDLLRCGVQGLVVNALHLAQAPGAGLVKSQGGIHSFMGWDRPVISDSGGFQAMSMIRENARYGTISDAGITFTNVDAPKRRKLKLTPEKCIQIQFDLGSDIMMCLDDCPCPNAHAREVAASVRRTILWARRCKQEFERRLAIRAGGHSASRAANREPLESEAAADGQPADGRTRKGERPRLFGIIQGGYDESARRSCAQELLSIGFDGYGFGGWPLDPDGNLATDTLAYTASLMPDSLPKYALGVGSPESILRCWQMGYAIFDCVLPTRDARHHRLYCADPSTGPDAYSFLYIRDDKHKRDSRPVSEVCDCYCCTHYSQSYLHHLFKVQDGLAYRLATIHNLRFYTLLMERLRRQGSSTVEARG